MHSSVAATNGSTGAMQSATAAATNRKGRERERERESKREKERKSEKKGGREGEREGERGRDLCGRGGGQVGPLLVLRCGLVLGSEDLVPHSRGQYRTSRSNGVGDRGAATRVWRRLRKGCAFQPPSSLCAWPVHVPRQDIQLECRRIAARWRGPRGVGRWRRRPRQIAAGVQAHEAW
eukprot:553448-Rhodomonas_salina.1